jgi:hydroxymethylbilane synthase
VRTIRLGTRGSKLALIQANHVKDKLVAAHGDDSSVELVIIKTSGDWQPEHGEVSLSEAKGGKGQFIKEIEKALQADEIDCGVHSLKDVPAYLPEGFVLSHILERENPFDALICADGNVSSLNDLPQESVIGTSSKRRAMFALAKRPDCRVEVLRGNVDTRLVKLKDGKADATFLAMAGLSRMDLLQHVSQELPADDMLPCAGQGAIGLEIREDDNALSAFLDPLMNEESYLRCVAERQVLKMINASCHTPIGVYAEYNGNHQMILRSAIGYETGKELLYSAQEAFVKDEQAAIQLGTELAEALMAQVPQEMQDALGVGLVEGDLANH